VKTWIRLKVPSRTLDERLHPRVEEQLECPTELVFETWAEETEHIMSLTDEAHRLADVMYE
jgi:anthranilate/para-aminobenzoate synthase component II